MSEASCSLLKYTKVITIRGHGPPGPRAGNFPMHYAEIFERESHCCDHSNTGPIARCIFHTNTLYAYSE